MDEVSHNIKSWMKFTFSSHTLHILPCFCLLSQVPSLIFPFSFYYTNYHRMYICLQCCTIARWTCMSPSFGFRSLFPIQSHFGTSHIHCNLLWVNLIGNMLVICCSDILHLGNTFQQFAHPFRIIIIEWNIRIAFWWTESWVTDWADLCRCLLKLHMKSLNSNNAYSAHLVCDSGINLIINSFMNLQLKTAQVHFTLKRNYNNNDKESKNAIDDCC